jgi:type-IV secretion system protein TraC
MKHIYESFANKAADLIGFEKTDLSLKSYYKKKLFENAMYGGESVRDSLQYRHFDEKRELFYLNGGRAGFMMEISPLVGVNDSVVRALNMFFAKDLPKDGVLQFFLMASSNIDGFLDFWEEGRVSEDPILKRITKSRSDYLRTQAQNFHTSGKKLPREFQIFVSYSAVVKNYSTSGYNDASLEVIQKFKNKIKDKFSGLGVEVKNSSSSDLIKMGREFFELSPGKTLNYKPLSKYDVLNDQILQSGNYYHSRKKGFFNETTNITHRAYKFVNTPDFWSLAQNIEMLGSSDGFPIPARFCISHMISNDFKTDKALHAQGKRVIDSAERSYSRHDKALIEEAGQWRDIIHALTSKGEVPLTDSLVFFLSGDAEEIDRAESDVMNMLTSNGWEIEALNYFHFEAILGNLPMHGSSYWDELKKYKLTQTSLSSEVVAKLPVHAEWYGANMSGVPFIGRRGQLFNWNPFFRMGSGNFNANVVGPSGVGKSVFLQAVSEAMLAQNVTMFILDIGKSYASLAKLLGGEIIEFGEENTFTINPFIGLSPLLSETDFNQLVVCAKELLSIMSGASGEYELAKLEEAIKDAALSHDYNLDLGSFATFLKNSDDKVLNDFATSLFSYTPGGVFGKYFLGDNAAKFDKTITIFEFESIRDQPKLISIILQTLLMQITAKFLSGDRSKRFMIIVDEAWMLLDHCAGFLAALARNLRRYGGSLVVCTQCFADLQTAGATVENNNHRRAIFENSAWTINLPPRTYTDYEAHTEFKEKIPLLKSLSFERGQYSEMLLSSSGIDVVGRLMLDPFSGAVYSTEAEDYRLLLEYEKQGVPMEKALGLLLDQKK